MFLHTVSGEYVKSGKLAQLSHYECQFAMSEGDKQKALSVIQNVLLTPTLRAQLGDFKHWRTASIIKTQKTDVGGGDPEFEEAALKASQMGCLPPSIDNYDTIDGKKIALMSAVEKKEEKERKRAKKEASSGTFIDEGFID